jgi:hypothetical protein
MAVRPMYNRRARRPDGGFHRNRRRGGVNTLSMLEGPSAEPSRLRVIISAILKKLRRK